MFDSAKLLSGSERPTYFHISNARARCRGDCLDFFLSPLSYIIFPLSLGDDSIKTEILSQRAVKP